MKKLKNNLILLLLPLMLVYCGGDNKKEKTNPDQTPDSPPADVAVIPQDIASCMTGIYSGKGDIRWNIFSWSQDLNVSIAFAGNSLLIKVEGEKGDLVCTHYEGISALTSNSPPTAEPDENTEYVITANKVTSRQTKGTAYYSRDLADSLNNDILVNQSSDPTKCTFSIGSVSLSDGRFGTDNDSIESEDLEKHRKSADFETLLNECGGIDAFTITLPKEEITATPELADPEESTESAELAGPEQPAE